MGAWAGKCQRPCANMDNARPLLILREAMLGVSARCGIPLRSTCRSRTSTDIMLRAEPQHHVARIILTGTQKKTERSPTRTPPRNQAPQLPFNAFCLRTAIENGGWNRQIKYHDDGKPNAIILVNKRNEIVGGHSNELKIGIDVGNWRSQDR